MPHDGAAVELELHGHFALSVRPAGAGIDDVAEQIIVCARDFPDRVKGGIHRTDTEAGILDYFPVHFHLHRGRGDGDVSADHIEVDQLVLSSTR